MSGVAKMMCQNCFFFVPRRTLWNCMYKCIWWLFWHIASWSFKIILNIFYCYYFFALFITAHTILFCTNGANYRINNDGTIINDMVWVPCAFNAFYFSTKWFCLCLYKRRSFRHYSRFDTPYIQNNTRIENAIHKNYYYWSWLHIIYQRNKKNITMCFSCGDKTYSHQIENQKSQQNHRNF